MSVYLKPGQLKIKDENGDYTGINTVALESTAEYLEEMETKGDQIIDDIEAKGEETIASIPDDYTELSEEVDELNERLSDNADELSDLLMPTTSMLEWSNGGITAEGQDYAYANQIVTKPVPIGSAVQYACTANAETGRVSFAHYYNANNVWLNRTQIIGGSTVTVPTNAYYVRFTYGFTSGDGRTVADYGFDNLVADYSLKAVKTLRTVMFAERAVPNNTISLASLRENGAYAIPASLMANLTDKPDGVPTTRNATLYNYTNALTGGFIEQVLSVETGNEFVRIINASNGNVYSSWKQSIVAGLSDKVFMGRSVLNTVLLSDYKISGVYGFTLSQFNSFTDKPDDTRTDVNYTLIVYDGAYSNGGYVIQELVNAYYEKWERSINKSTGAVLVDWSRIDGSVGNVLYGKKLVTAGDSYTEAGFTGDYAEYYGKNFGYYIAQRNKMTFVNAGVSGSTMTSGTGSSNPFSTSRYQAVPSDTDYLTIWFGINDSGLDLPVGTIDDTSVNTFYGAWNTVLEYYLTNYPFMKILIIVTTNAKTAYREAVVNVAKKWGYPYMDWVNDYSIPAFFQRTDISEDALDLRKDAFGWNGPVQYHPNPQWHIYESSIIEARLRAI